MVDIRAAADIVRPGAEVAELVDAPDSKSGVLADVSVRLRLLVGNYPRERIFFMVFLEAACLLLKGVNAIIKEKERM